MTEPPKVKATRTRPLKQLHEEFITMFNRDDVQEKYHNCAKHKRAALLAGHFFNEQMETISLSWVYRVMRDAQKREKAEEGEQKPKEGEIIENFNLTEKNDGTIRAPTN
jgi:hypothetical protein